jgi:hypothetical protein
MCRELTCAKGKRKSGVLAINSELITIKNLEHTLSLFQSIYSKTSIFALYEKKVPTWHRE